MRERDLFLTALEIEDHAARQAHLKTECGDDVALLARVESLLASHEGQSQFLNTPVVEQLAEVTEADISEVEGAATIAYANGSTQDNVPDATTRFSSGVSPMTKPQADDDDQIPLGYLEPTTKPGSLGRLAHYEVLEVIGRGAFGTVLRAFDEKLHRVVAIKVMSAEMAATSPARKRFIREAQMSAAIRHEHVVSIYAVEEKPLPYIVMEYIPGKTLQQRLDERGPLDVPTVLRIGKQIADGLAAAHAQDLIHRDIKPANILLETGAREMVKVTDFGLARAADDASLTQSGTIAGTPMYMAPEQAMGHKLDQRADLFSLGSVLYQMLSGRPPFRAANTVAVLKRVVDDTPRPIQEIIPEVPTWMCELVSQLHAKNPDERIQTAKEVSDLLGQCLDDLKAGRVPKISRPSSCTAPTVEHSPVVVAKPDQPPRPEVLRRSPLVKVAAVALVVLGLIGITEVTGVTKFASTVVRLATGSGTLVIETDEPDVKIANDGKAVHFTDAEVKSIAALPAADQVKEVRKELMRRNPGFDGTIRHKIEGDVVSEIKIVTDHVTDIAPLRVFNSLKVLDLGGSHTNFQGNGQLADLSPLQGMNFTGLTKLELSWTRISDADLAHFKDSKHLTSLGLGETKVTDAGLAYFKDCKELQRLELFSIKQLSDKGLAHFKDCKSLIRLQLAETTVSDAALSHFRNCTLITDLFLQGNKQLSEAGLVHFKDCKLKTLLIKYTNVRDLTVLRNWPLKLVACDFQADRDTEILRSITTLETINDKPAAEFLKLADASRKTRSTFKWPVDAPSPAIAPFDAAQAKAHQEAWAKHLGVPIEYTNSIGMKFRLIPPGEFMMGSSAAEIEAALKVVDPNDNHWKECIKSEAPQHKVILTQPIYLGVNEVTQAEYEKVMGVNPAHFAPTGMGKEAVAGLETADHPVEMVSWNDAAEFCAKLSKQQKLKPFYVRERETVTPLDGTGYRLPSEAEWEFACRAGTATKYWTGDKDEDLVRAGWFGEPASGRTHAAGKLNANPFGLFDIHGNVWEWVQESWDASYYGQSQEKPAINPNNAFSAGSERVFRGGAWDYAASRCRSSGRGAYDTSLRSLLIGFRVSLSVNGVKAAIASSNTIDVAKAIRRFASDEWIDVIPLIEPQADKWDVPQRTGKNAWRIENGELVVGRDTLASKLLLPLDSDWPAYECELEFTRRAGNSGFNVNLPTKTGECPLLFDPTGNSGAFLGSRAKGVLLKTGTQLVTGERTTIRFDIRRQKAVDHVSVALNGVAIGEWNGDRTEISYSYREGFPHDRRMSLWIHPGGNEFVFHRIRVRMLDGGTAETLREVATTPPVPVVNQQLPPTFKNSIGIEFVIVPKGKSWLRDKEVEIPADFYLGKYEITQEEWEKVMGYNPSHFGPANQMLAGMATNKFPVESVNWYECVEYCNKLSEREGLKPYYELKVTKRSGKGDLQIEEAVVKILGGKGYHIPTDVEWEHGCRAGSKTGYHCGSDDTVLLEYAWFDKNSDRHSHAVGEKKPNAFGLHDMHGNVLEWNEEMLTTERGQERIARGGDLFNVATNCEVHARFQYVAAIRLENTGLRLARLPSGDPSSEAKTTSSAVAPFTDTEVKRIAALPAAEQVEEVRKELKKRNPEFDGTLTPTIENDVVTGIEFFTNHVSDISPVRAFPHLTSLNCRADGSLAGMVSDLKPLKGMQLTKLTLSVNPLSDLSPLKGMPLTDLHIDNSDVADLSPLEGMPLKLLNCSYTKVSTLASLKGMPLTVVWCNNTEIADLSPVKGMSLEWITIHGTKVKNLAPLKGMPLTQIYLDFKPVRDTELLRSISTLVKINDEPAAEFLKE